MLPGAKVDFRKYDLIIISTSTMYKVHEKSPIISVRGTKSVSLCRIVRASLVATVVVCSLSSQTTPPTNQTYSQGTRPNHTGLPH